MQSSNARRRFLLPGLVALGSLLSACGNPTAPAHSTPQTSTPSASATQAGASPTPATLTNAAAKLTLTADQLPASPAGALTLTADSLLSREGNTDARVFATTDRSFALEIDMLPDSSPSAASNDYTAVRDAAKGRVITVAAMSSPNIGDQADEYRGTSGDGKQIVAVVFQQGAVLCAVLTEASAGDAHPDYAEAVASAQAQKIKSLS